MKHAYTAMALLSLVALLPCTAKAGEFGGGSSGYVDTPLGPIPMDLMVQAGGCPYTASDLYQQRLLFQQQQYMSQMQKSGNNPYGTPQPNATAGTAASTTKTLVSSASSKKKKRVASRNKKASAGSATVDSARSTTSATELH